MKRLLGIVLIGGLGAGMLFATGCASDGQKAKADADTHAYVSGMMCPECETVWVTERSSHGGPHQITMFHSKAKMTCPTCDETADRVLLGDGKVQLHDCPHCKVTPQAIKSADRPNDFPFKGGRR